MNMPPVCQVKHVATFQWEGVDYQILDARPNHQAGVRLPDGKVLALRWADTLPARITEVTEGPVKGVVAEAIHFPAGA